MKVLLKFPLGQAMVDRIEPLLYAPVWAVAIVVCITAGPAMVVWHGSRGWLRRYFPDVIVLTWDEAGITLSDGRQLSWREFKGIYKGFTRKRTALTILTDAFGESGKICIPTSLIREPEKALADLTAARLEFLKRQARIDVAAKMAAIQSEVSAKLLDCYSKPMSQLRAEGLVAGDHIALHAQFTEAAVKRAFTLPSKG